MLLREKTRGGRGFNQRCDSKFEVEKTICWACREILLMKCIGVDSKKIYKGSTS